MKRFIAALLTVAMAVSFVPFSVFAEGSGTESLPETSAESTAAQQEEMARALQSTYDPFGRNYVSAQTEENQSQQAEVDTSDVSLTATNSFGQLLVNSMDEQNGTNGEYTSRVTSLKMNGHTATVEFVTDKAADLVVAVYTDSDAEEMVASGTAEVSGSGGNDSVSVAIQGEIPEYYTVKAFLLNKNTHEPLSQVYTDSSRTKVMVDLSTAKASDFPEDRVINLDGQGDTNFAVVSDETTLVTYENNAAGKNQVISEDDDALVYVIGNASDEIKNLQPNDILTYEYEPGVMLIARVQNITVSGDTVTIYGDSALDISDVFDAVKIESDADSGDFTYDGTEADAGVEYNGTSYDEPDEIDLTNAAGQGEIKVGNEFILKEVGDSNLKVKGSIKISLGIKIQYYFANDMTFISDSNEFEVTGAVSFSAKSEGEIKLGSLGVRPIFGLWVGFEPVVKGKAEITGKLQLKYTATIGAEYYSSSGFSNTSKEPEVEFNISAEGSLYIGFDFKPKAKILEKVTVLTLDAEVGAELKGTKKITTIDNDTFNDESRHACAGCFEVKVSTIVKVGATLEIIGITPKKKQFAELTLGPLEGYYSPEYDEWGWNKCPHELYRVILSVDQENPQGISYLMGSMSDVLEGKAKALGGIALENGKMRCYLAPGTYTVAAVKDSNVPYGDATFTITENAVDVQIKAGSIDISKPEPDKPGTGEKPDKPGTSTTMSWSLNENGKLTIEGKGEMDQKGEWNKAEDVPWNAVRSEIKEVEIAEGITSVGSYAFYDCKNLTDVVIPSGVTSIGSYAFFGCRSLASVAIPDSVTSIGNHAFLGCRSLISVEIPNSVISIGGAAFDSCSSLTRIIISNSVTNIGDATFYGCSSLTSIEISNSITRIGSSVFNGCSSLTHITIPDGVTNIGDHAFSGCRSLTSIEIPNGVTSIGDFVFYACENLTSVTIPSSVTSIGNYAFYGGCGSLTSIEIPNGITSIGESTFSGCSGLARVEIPSSVTSIGSGAFSKCSSLTSIEIPNGLTSISDFVFFGCSSLTNITIPSSVTSIGGYAFEGCSSLTSIAIPNGVTGISDFVFEDCKNLTSITIPSSVTSIGDYAFFGCSRLTNITIPNQVASIGHAAFYDCGSLTSITIPNGVTIIESSTFANCSSLTSIEIPSSVIGISGAAFYGCSSLTNVFYSGTREQWNKIPSESSNDPLLSATIHCTDGDILPENTSSENSITTGSAAASNGTFSAAFDNVSAGKDYAVIISRSETNPLNPDNLIYINQITAATDGELSVPFRTGASTGEMVYVVACARDDITIDPVQPIDPVNPDAPSGDGDGAGAAIAIVGGVVAVAAVAGVVLMVPVEVSGTVKCTNQAVLPAAVQVLQGDKVIAETVTDAEGRFTVKVRRGSYTLRVRYVGADGYPVTRTVDFKAPNKNLNVAA